MVDMISVWLIGIASVIFFIPQIKEVLPFLKRMKFGGTEIEFYEELKEFGKQFEQFQAKVPSKPIPIVDKGAEEEIEKIILIATTNPHAALLLLSAKLEGSVRIRLIDEKLLSEDKYFNLPSMISIGSEAGIFPRRYFNIVLDFWVLRNRVAHGFDVDVSNAELISLITMGTEILRLVPMKE